MENGLHESAIPRTTFKTITMTSPSADKLIFKNEDKMLKDIEKLKEMIEKTLTEARHNIFGEILPIEEIETS